MYTELYVRTPLKLYTSFRNVFAYANICLDLNPQRFIVLIMKGLTVCRWRLQVYYILVYKLCKCLCRKCEELSRRLYYLF